MATLLGVAIPEGDNGNVAERIVPYVHAGAPSAAPGTWDRAAKQPIPRDIITGPRGAQPH
jgi:hypothetical protein